MSENTKAVTDDELQDRRAGGQRSGAGGFLGGVVRPLQDDRARRWRRSPASWPGKLTVAKVNIDDNPMTPNDYGVRGIPTLILFKDGKPAATQVGALPRAA